MLLTALKCPSQWLTKHGLLSGFVATMLGVLAAFWLRGCGEQRALDSATKQRLHIAVLESQYNGTDAVEIMRACESSGNISIRRPDTVAAAAAFGDANILAVLPKHEVSMLRAYINAVATLNEALQLHRTLVASAGGGPTLADGPIRENLRSNAAAVAANAHVLQEKLSPYFDEADYDHEQMQRIEDHIKHVKEEVLRNNVPLSKEE
jgi:hypothetical protein